MSTRTQRNPESLKTTDHLKRMAAADFRSLLSGHEDAPTLRDLAAYPGVSHFTTLSKQQNGRSPSPFSLLYCLLCAMADEGVPLEHAKKASAAVDNAIAVIYAERDERSLREVMYEAQRVDLAEDQAEARVHAEGFSLGSIMTLRDRKREARIHEKLVESRLSREIRERRSA